MVTVSGCVKQMFLGVYATQRSDLPAVIQSEPVREKHVLPRGLQYRHKADNS